MTAAHTLVVVRHAKAEPYAETDVARSLTRRGHTDAAAAGRHLADSGIRPDRALVSSAVRTRQTWEHLAEAMDGPAEAELRDELYAASVETVLEHLRDLPEEVGTAVYVGHNPAAGSLAYALDDGEGDPAVVGELLGGFPTSAVAVFSVPGPWAHLEEGTARLSHVHMPGHRGD